jgi:heterodisulfide reductase subunit C
VLKNEASFTWFVQGALPPQCNLIDFNVRKINLFLRRCDIESLAREIDKCMLCGKCTLVCPRDINIRNVVMLIKKGIVKFRNE